MEDLVKFMREEDRAYEIEEELKSIYRSIGYLYKETGTDTPIAYMLDEVLDDFGKDKDIIIKTLKKESTDIDLKLLVKFKDTLNEEINDFIRLMNDFM